MARTWLEVEVVLVGVAGDEQRDPGRVFVVGPSHSFGQLADAINTAFGLRAGWRTQDRISR